MNSPSLRPITFSSRSAVSLSLKRVLAGAALLGSLACLPVRAVPVTAFSFTGGQGVGGPTITLGYDFTVNQNLQVTDIGWFDQNNNGLSASHEVGIWRTDGTLLTSLVIPSGTAATLDNRFRYVSMVTPLFLSTGSYVIAGKMNGESYIQDATINNLTTLVTYGSSRVHNADANFVFPEKINPFGDNAGYFGPNLKVEAVAGVPDGGGLSLIFLGLLALGLVRRFQRAA